MPKRDEIKKAPAPNKKAGENAYTYEELLIHMRKHIDKQFGGVAKFIESNEFLQCGLVNNKEERAKIFTYLSMPDSLGKSKVKSFPVLEKLYKHLLGVEVESKIVVERKQILTTNILLTD